MIAIVNFIAEKAIPLLLSVVGFGLLIVVHELGHLFFCKLFNIYVPSFSIGFGPKIFEKTIGETTYRLAQIPFGGYVEIAGQEEIAQGEQKFAHDKSERSYATKPFWQKILVWLGGIMFNLIFAYATFIGLFIFSSQDASHLVISNIAQSSPAEKSGLQNGDEILGINGINLADATNNQTRHAQKILLETIQANPNKKIVLEIKRDEKIIQSLAVTLGSRKNGDKEIGILGTAFASSVIHKLPFTQAVAAGIEETNYWIATIAMGLKNFFSQVTLEGAGGPIMIFAQGFKTAQHGIASLFVFLAIMSVNLALFNLLPLGITDGGQLMFAIIEFIIRRPLPNNARIAINVVSLVLFVLLATYLTYKDIATLFGSHLKVFYEYIINLIG